MVSREAGNSTLVKKWQRANAISSMDVKVVGNFTLANEKQSQNTPSSMDVREVEERSTLVNAQL